MPTEKAHGLQITKMIESFFLLGFDVELLVPKRDNRVKDTIGKYYSLRFEPKVLFIGDCFAFVKKINEKFYFILQRFSFIFGAFIRVIKSDADFIYSREITLCFLLSVFIKNKIIVFEDHEPKKSSRFTYAFFLKKIPKKIIVPYHLEKLYKELGVKEDSFIVAPNGVDIGEFKNIVEDKSIWQKDFGISSEKKIVLYVGHFYKWKGVYTLIDSAKFLSPDICVVLIGGVPIDIEKVRNYLREKQIENVFLFSFVPHRQVLKYIKSADILALPNTAKEERSLKYTTPIKLFEYMASGVPILASDIPSFSHFLKNNENAVFCRPDDPNDIARKIDYLLKDKILMDKISSAALGNVEEFSWVKRTEKILDFITH